MSQTAQTDQAATTRTFLCLATALFLASLGNSIANIALPALALAFEASVQSTSWVVGSYLATLTLFSLAAGYLGDRIGRRETLIAGLVLFSLASALCGLAASLPLLIAARGLQGIGAAILMVLSLALVRDTTPPDRVGRAMGVLGSVSAVGTATGPVLGGALIAPFGWSAVFLVLVPGGLAALALTLRALPSGRRPNATPRSPGFRLGFRPGFRSVPLAMSWTNLTANFIVAMVMMTTLIIGPFFLDLALGLRQALVGLVMAIGPMLSILSGVPSGRMVDAFGARRVLLCGLLALVIGAFALALLSPEIGLIGYIIAIAVLTPGYQLFQSANNTATLASVPSGQRGTVSGLLALSRNLGLLAGATAMAAVFAFGTGAAATVETAAPQAIASGLRLAFLVSGGLLAFALLLMTRHHRAPG